MDKTQFAVKLAVILAIHVGVTAAPFAAEKRASEATLTDIELKGGQLSPFDACKNVILVESSRYQKNLDFWKEYQSDCAGKVLVQTMPDTGFFNRSFDDKPGKSLSGTLNAVGFMEKIGTETVKSLEQGIDVLKAADACTAKYWVASTQALLDKAAEKLGRKMTCDEIQNAAAAKLKAKLPEARFHLAFLTDHFASEDMKRGKMKYTLNKDLNSSGKGIFHLFGPMHAEMDPLTQEEIAAVETQFQKERGELMAEYDRLVEKEVKERLRVIENIPNVAAERKKSVEQRARENMERERYKWAGEQMIQRHKVQYLQTLSEAPQLAYYGKADVTAKDLAKVWPEMIKDATKELERAKKLLSEGKTIFSENNNKEASKELEDSMLGFMGNKMIIEKILSDEIREGKPTNCAVATGLMNFIESRNNREMAAIATSLVGGFTVGPRLMAATLGAGAVKLSTAGNLFVAAGVATGASFTIHDYNAAVDTERKAKTGLTDFAAAQEKRDQFGWSLALHPLDYIGVGAAAGAAGKFATTAFAKGSLRANGVSKEDTQRLIKLLNSDDQSVRKATGSQIEEIKKLAEAAEKEAFAGRKATPEENQIVEAAVGKGLLGTPDKPAIDITQEIANRVNKLEAADRKAFYDRTLSLVQKYSPAKTATAEDRKETMRTIMELAHFGVKDEKAIAEIINNWPSSSVKGLGLSVKTARAHLGKQKLASKEAFAQAQEIAQMSALAELKYNKPLKELTPAENAEVRQMCVCSTFCPKSSSAASIDPGTGFEVASVNSCTGS